MTSATLLAAILSRTARRGALALLLAAPVPAWAAETARTPETVRSPDKVVVLPDQLHQLSVATVEVGSFGPRKSAIGQIAFNEDASTAVMAPFSGRVTRVIAKIGDMVKAGEPLFEIDSPEVLQAQTDLIAAVQAVEKSRAQFALAKRVLDRQAALLAGKATAMREVDQARQDFTAAESDLATAQGALTAARNKVRVLANRDEATIARIERERIVDARITVNAPILGTVIARKVGPGQFVRIDAGEALYTISDLSTMWLKAYVPESDSPFIRVGQQVEVKVSAFPSRNYTATITAIGAASDQSTRRVIVRSEIPNPDGELKAEMFATFRITVGAIQTAPVVPADAIIREANAASVWVESGERTFTRRPLTLGAQEGQQVQVLDGLKAGERIVTRGAIFIDNEAKQ